MSRLTLLKIAIALILLDDEDSPTPVFTFPNKIRYAHRGRRRSTLHRLK